MHVSFYSCSGCQNRTIKCEINNRPKGLNGQLSIRDSTLISYQKGLICISPNPSYNK